MIFLFPEITNHTSTTKANSSRWVKNCTIILLPHSGELKNRKGTSFSQGHTVSGIRTLCSVIVLLAKLLLTHFLPLMDHPLGLPGTGTRDIKFGGYHLLCSFFKMVRFWEPLRLLKGRMEFGTFEGQWFNTFSTFPKDKAKNTGIPKRTQQMCWDFPKKHGGFLHAKDLSRAF